MNPWGPLSQRIDRLLRVLKVDAYAIVEPDVFTLHVFVPVRVTTIVTLMLNRERSAGQLVKVTSLNLLMAEDT